MCARCRKPSEEFTVVVCTSTREARGMCAPSLSLYCGLGGGGHNRPREVVPADRPPRLVGGSGLGIRPRSRQAKIVPKKGKMKNTD